MKLNLTEEEIQRQLANGTMDKSSVCQSLKWIVEHDPNKVNRIRSVEMLSQLDLRESGMYDFLENLMISDTNAHVRNAAVKVLISRFPNRYVKPLKWVIEREDSALILNTILSMLEASNNQDHENLKTQLSNELERRYGVDPEEAVLLLKIECICKYGNEKGSIDFEYSTENGHVSAIAFTVLFIENFQRIQPYLTTFKNLEALSMREIGGDGVFTGIGELTSLTVLRIEDSAISDISEIQGLDKLVNLEELQINFTHITEIKGLDDLIKLKTLNLECNKITEIKGLENLRNLEELYLGGNPITEIKDLENLVKLKVLYFNPIGENEHKGLITEIKGLDSLVNLEELNLMFNEITEIKGLENLLNLKKLNLGFNKIKEIKGLSHFTNIEAVDLSSNEITEINGIEQLPFLKNISLDYNKITDKKGLHIYDRPYFIYSHFKFPKINFIKKKGNEKKPQIRQTSLKDFLD